LGFLIFKIKIPFVLVIWGKKKKKKKKKPQVNFGYLKNLKVQKKS
jgi:hypothetical protein